MYNTSFWSIRRINYYRRKHDNLLGSENNIFWSKNVIFLTFLQKPENRPLLAHQKGHNFWTAQPILIIFVPKFPILYVLSYKTIIGWFISISIFGLTTLVRVTEASLWFKTTFLMFVERMARALTVIFRFLTCCWYQESLILSKVIVLNTTFCWFVTATYSGNFFKRRHRCCRCCLVDSSDYFGAPSLQVN